MKDVKELELQDLRWVQVGMGQNYELRNEQEEVVAKITRPRWYSRRAEVDAPGNRWSFEQRGIFKRRVLIKSLATADSPAEFSFGFYEGKLEFPDGRVFFWKRGNFWGTKWVWTTEDGMPILGYQTGGFLRFQGQINIEPDDSGQPGLGLLVFLGWYLVSLYHEDSSSAAVVSVG